MEYLFEEGRGGIYCYITLPMASSSKAGRYRRVAWPADERESVTYSGTPDPVPSPAPGVRFDGIGTSRYADGGETRYSLSAMVGAGAAGRYRGLQLYRPADGRHARRDGRARSTATP